MVLNPDKFNPDTGDSELDDILVQSYRSTKFFAQVFLSERFYGPMNSFTDEIFEAIDSGHPRVVIASPRGIGKTSIVNLALPLREIVFGGAHFFVSVSQSSTLAEMQTENLRMELVTNKLVRRAISYIYGINTIKPKAYEGIEESFSKKTWTLFGRTMVLPRGSGQQIRGLIYKNWRPDLLVFDDLEDAETIDNEEIREKRRRWFYADAIYVGDRYKRNLRIVYIDTLKHADALLEELLNNPEWLAIRQSICDEDFNSLDESVMTTEEIKKMADMARDSNTLPLFAMEQMNRPVVMSESDFSPRYFKHYMESDPEFVAKLEAGDIESVVLVDPAKTTSRESADTAVVGVGVDLKSNIIYVRDIAKGKMHPHEMIDTAFEMATRLKARVIGVEVNSLEEYITYPIYNEMLRRRKSFEIVELKPRRGVGKGKGKVDRIKTLIPFYRRGQVYHNKVCCTPLEVQLMSFPKSKKWDVMDCFAYIVQLLEKGSRYFYPPEVSFEDPKDIEKEYEELEYEPPLDYEELI